MCKGCGLCVAACPRDCIEMASHVNVKGYPPAFHAHPDKCRGCGNCGVVCPDAVIDVFREIKVKKG
ncbi:MAG: 4Fe-4S dicluster domain-containing protein [Planctomycetota bacterium]|nr:MAG: 4Fe-4S dicluster domain-containing protein [Planctomycetota bacterium]